MKVLQSSFFRAVIAIVVGLLLIKYREATAHWLTIAIGALFFISGLISCVVYYSMRKHADEPQAVDAQGIPQNADKPSFPIVGLGSLILGIILALMPSTFLAGLTYIMAAILILGAINQYANLALAKKYCHIGLFFWLLPSLILLTGIVVIVKHIDPVSTVLLIIGWSMLLYGATECLNAVKIYQANKRKKVAQESVQTAQPTNETPEAEAQPTEDHQPEQPS
jgi:uncharacterized membrane protein HdeD (DUF308 family)